MTKSITTLENRALELCKDYMCKIDQLESIEDECREMLQSVMSNSDASFPSVYSTILYLLEVHTNMTNEMDIQLQSLENSYPALNGLLKEMNLDFNTVD